MADNKWSIRFFAILFFVIGVGLLFFVGTNMYAIYRGSIKDVNVTEEANKVDCYQMAFQANYVSDLKINVENLVISSFDLDELTFLDFATGEHKIKKQDYFIPGSDRDIDITKIGYNSFYIYPYDCVAIAWVCNVSEEKCYDPHQYNQ